MASPRTLPALRAAVARVLQARGEAADALPVEERWSHGGSRPAIVVGSRSAADGNPSLRMWCAPADGRGPIDAAWTEIVRRLESADAQAQDVARRTSAALAVARGIGGES